MPETDALDYIREQKKKSRKFFNESFVIEIE